MSRPIYIIAQDIKKEWGNVNFAAKPYLDAMHELYSITDSYGLDSGTSIVNYFLCNAMHFRGTRAKELKQELRELLRACRN